MNTKDIEFMVQFLGDQKSNSGLITEVTARALEELYNQYRKTNVDTGDVIITCKAGKYGHLHIYQVTEGDNSKSLSYIPRHYESISIKAVEETILWTDDSPTEPYNRQGVLYVPYSWANLIFKGNGDGYREFNTDLRPTNISFGVWGFDHNTHWNTIQFGICVEKDKAEEFIAKLRELLNKPTF